MIRICWPAAELQQLQRLFRTTDDRTWRDRIQIVLMAQRGRPHQQIAADLGVTPRTAQRWLDAYPERGTDGLRPRQAPGATPKLTADLAPLLQRWVIDGPAACGPGRANWTYAEIDNAPWHGGEPIRKARADNPHRELKRLPSYSPQLNVIERFGKLLRRRATRNRLFDTLADLKRSIRASLCYFQTVRQRIRTLIAKCYPRPVNQTASAGP